MHRGSVLRAFVAIYFGIAPQVPGFHIQLYNDDAPVEDRVFRDMLNRFAVHRLGPEWNSLFPNGQSVRFVVETLQIAGMTLQPALWTWQFVRADIARTLWSH